jgi:HPt (histidine-containing phosphotransfer) domain-containing protein
MTAHAMRGDREKCLAAGMNDYVSKPVEVTELRAALQRWQSSAVPAPLASSAAAAPATATASGLGVPATAGANLPAEGAEPPKAPVPSGPPVDLGQLREACRGDEAKLGELITLFLTQSEEGITKIEAALRADSAEDLIRAAHRLYGASASCGMHSLSQAVRELERLGHERRMADAMAVFGRAAEEHRRIGRFLKVYLKTTGWSPPAAAPTAAAVVPAPTPVSPPPSPPVPERAAEPPVDLKRLRRVCLGNEQKMIEMAHLYLEQAERLLHQAEDALQSGSARELEQAAHKLAGSSATCGMNATVPALRTLEQLGSEQRLAEAGPAMAEAREQHARVRVFLQTHFASPADSRAKVTGL